MKAFLEKYNQMQENFFQTIEKGCERMKSANSKIDEDKEVADFIKANKSGQKIPPPEEFNPYVVQISDEARSGRFSVSVAGTESPSSSSSLSRSASTASVNIGSDSKSPSTSAAVSATASPKVLKKVKASYDYNPEDPENELAMQEGDIIEVLEMDDSGGWWMGINKGKQGYFPSNFVVELTASAPVAPGGSETVKALYDYAGGDGELSFKENDVITVVSKGADGWWEGLLNGKTGVFPSNYTDAKDAPSVD